MVGGVSTGALSALFRQQTVDHSRLLGQIASGKRFTRPSDDFVNYSRMNQQRADIRTIQSQNDELVWARGAAKFGADVMGTIYRDVEQLRKWAVEIKGLEDIQNPTKEIEDRIKELTGDFEALASSVGTLFAASKTFNNMDVFTKDVEHTVNIGIGENTQSLIWTINADLSDDLAAIKLADFQGDDFGLIDEIKTYMREANAFVGAIDRQLTINENTISAKSDVANAIGAIDEMRAINDLTTISIRQQATVAMATQANMSQINLARLFQ